MYWRLFVPVISMVFGFCTAISLGCFTISSSTTDNSCIAKRELTRIPGWKFAFQKQEECNFPDPAEVSIAMQVFYTTWYDQFGDSADVVLNNLNNFIVDWRSNLVPFERGYKVDGTFVEKGLASGLTLAKDHIIVKREFGQKIYETSFVHELVHASIRASNPQNHGDPDHEGPKYEGWTKDHTEFIKYVNEILRLMDLNYAEENKKTYFFTKD
jgi:hypothetical protein